ncbi:MAG: hypothetical protein LWW93_00515 [Hyphomicrobiales bacterium]|nr:hypothetical protein [Hyphomicrobiales bacterium]
MVATARPLPRSVAVRPAPARRPTPAKTPAHAHGAASKPASNGSLGYVLIAIAVAIGAAIAIGVIWEFGAARTIPVPAVAIPNGAVDGGSRGSAPTVMYKDMRDGRVLVYEVGPEGTRLKGAISKSELPFAENMNGEGAMSSRKTDTNASDRVNALGSAFR